MKFDWIECVFVWNNELCPEGHKFRNRLTYVEYKEEEGLQRLKTLVYLY